MRRNKKVFVYMMLLVVFVAQLAISGLFKSDANETEDNVAVMAVSNLTADNLTGVSAVTMTDTVTRENSVEADIQVALAADTEQIIAPDKVSTTNTIVAPDNVSASNTVIAPEDNSAVVYTMTGTVLDPQVEHRAIYMSTVSTRGEIIDDLSGYVSKSDFDNKLISYCENRVSVYAEPDASSAVVGCMYSRSQADILEKGEEWTKISSGQVVGYVRNVFMLFGEEAQRVAPYLGTKTTTVDVDQLVVYELADDTSDVIAVLSYGDVISAYQETGKWVFIECDAGFGFVLEQGIISTYDIATAWTIEEEQAYLAELARIEAERRQRELEEQARRARAESEIIDVQLMEPMYVSDAEKYLLACIIEWEAGWEPYEGKLAVANVVLNRVRSPRFKQNTITDVIYAPGQFTGVRGDDGGPSYRFRTEIIEPGPRHEECYKAAEEALAGINNIGDYMFFISMKKANFGAYSRYHIINNHCFYAK